MPVVYLAIEHPVDVLVERFLSVVSGISLEKSYEGAFSDRDKLIYQKALDTSTPALLLPPDPGEVYPPEMVAPIL